MYQDVRGPDGRLLFRIDPDRMVVEVVKRGVVYVVDLTVYMALSLDIAHPFDVD